MDKRQSVIFEYRTIGQSQIYQDAQVGTISCNQFDPLSVWEADPTNMKRSYIRNKTDNKIPLYASPSCCKVSGINHKHWALDYWFSSYFFADCFSYCFSWCCFSFPLYFYFLCCCSILMNNNIRTFRTRKNGVCIFIH